MRSSSQASGFSLLEVVIALAILAMSLTVLLDAQGQSIDYANRTKRLSIASLLARSKMIDMEVKLREDGLSLGVEEFDGDFKDEEIKGYTWKAAIREIKLDLAGLSSLCEMMAAQGEASVDSAHEPSEGAGGCEAVLGGIGGIALGAVNSFTEEIARSARLIEVEVIWHDGRYSDSMKIRGLATREDFSLEPEPMSEILKDGLGVGK